MIRWLLSLVVGLVASPAWADCTDYSENTDALVELEPAAIKGALDDSQKKCLEMGYAKAEQQTTKDKISRVLLVNAYAYSTTEWATLVQRHLDEVDRSDPDIAYLYAFYLFNTESAEPDEVIKWTELGLERKDVWEGRTFVSRVYGLMKLRAMAANRRWAAAEAKSADGDPPERLDDYKNEVKVFAREWVDFSKVAGRDTEESLNLCLSAATRAACGVEG